LLKPRPEPGLDWLLCSNWLHSGCQPSDRDLVQQSNSCRGYTCIVNQIAIRQMKPDTTCSAAKWKVDSPNGRQKCKNIVVGFLRLGQRTFGPYQAESPLGTLRVVWGVLRRAPFRHPGPALHPSEVQGYLAHKKQCPPRTLQ